MDSRRLLNTDLNLLKALQVLIEEKNVTRAAQRLFITQPAMSKTLQRLRELFDDPLFTRSGKGLIATPRTEALALQLPAILVEIESLLGTEDFYPEQYEGEIKVMVAAFIAQQLVPGFIKQLEQKAPKMTLSVMSGPVETVEKDLENGDLDLAVMFASQHSPNVVATYFDTISPSIWMNSEHPLANREKLLLADILEYPFVQYGLMHVGALSRAVETRFDREIAKKGLSRRRILITNQFMTAIEAVKRTDCLMLAAISDFTENRFLDTGMVEKPYPEDLQFDSRIPVVILQHQRTINSPAHQWIKQMMFDVVINARPEVSAMSF